MYLFVAAVEQELENLYQLAPAGATHDFCACGVGMVAAAANLSRVLQAFDGGQKCEVVFLGSCGSLRKRQEILSPVIAKDVSLVDFLTCEKKAYVPELVHKSYRADLELSKKVLGSDSFYRGSFYSTIGISSHEVCELTYSKETSGEFENMELFGVAEACAQHSVSWSALSVVTNEIGPNAHSQWLDNKNEASMLTTKLIFKNLLSV